MSEFKARLAGGGTQIGLFQTLASPITAEICAGAGFDWILFDAEHGPQDVSAILTLLQAVAPYPVEPVVRLPNGDPVLIKRYLDIGVRTLLIPMVESGEQAATMVRATRYPPYGMRGVGAGLARASRWGANADYLASANDSICLFVQVESVDGIAALDAILATDGVDGVFVGPADLAASMGHLGQPAHPDVQAAVDSAIRRICGAGKVAGYYAVSTDAAQHAIDLGARFVAVGADSAVLARGVEALAKSFGKRTTVPPTSY